MRSEASSTSVNVCSSHREPLLALELLLLARLTILRPHLVQDAPVSSIPRYAASFATLTIPPHLQVPYSYSTAYPGNLESESNARPALRSTTTKYPQLCQAIARLRVARGFSTPRWGRSGIPHPLGKLIPGGWSTSDRMDPGSTPSFALSRLTMGGANRSHANLTRLARPASMRLPEKRLTE